MDEHIKANREMWNKWAPLHAGSEFYDVEGFKNGRCTLKSIELEELGDVSGKSLLHLQCHFGLDTLSWARLRAKVTGVDFSDKAITLARSLSRELEIEADFICSNIYDLPKNLDGEFDIVFTSYGVLCWLPDLQRWAEVISHFLKPGGTFYIVEGHPLMTIFDNSEDATELKVTQPYFHTAEPMKWEGTGSYAGIQEDKLHTSYEWTHSLGNILNALIRAGLRIEFLHEFPVASYPGFPFTEQDKAGWWRVKGNNIPLTFSLKATKTT